MVRKKRVKTLDFVMMINDCVGQLFSAIKEGGVEGNLLVVYAIGNGGAQMAKIDLLNAKDYY